MLSKNKKKKTVRKKTTMHAGEKIRSHGGKREGGGAARFWAKRDSLRKKKGAQKGGFAGGLGGGQTRTRRDYGNLKKRGNERYSVRERYKKRLSLLRGKGGRINQAERKGGRFGKEGKSLLTKSKVYAAG